MKKTISDLINQSVQTSRIGMICAILIGAMMMFALFYIIQIYMEDKNETKNRKEFR